MTVEQKFAGKFSIYSTPFLPIKDWAKAMAKIAYTPLAQGEMVAQIESAKVVTVLCVTGATAMQPLDSVLRQAGMATVPVSDAGSAALLIWRCMPSLILIDLRHDGGDGMDLCRRLRADRRSAPIPLILLSEQCDETDRVLGFELGADDFIQMPVGNRELIARIKSLVRRSSAPPPPPPEILIHGDLVIDTGRCRAEFRGSTVLLTPTEFRILHFLAQAPQRVHSRQQIMQAIHCDDPDATGRSVDPHINAIRRKIGHDADCIQTVRGFGYRLK